ncbi:MAG: hypothetical protein HC803_01700 [Saprospiraceae bacterium]|nr:hypothetical protein [Saprospiraceae bacterium]
MKNLLHPRWLFLINTLPVAIFLILSSFEFIVVRTELEQKDLLVWGIFAGILVIASAIIFFYATKARKIEKNRTIR